MCSNSRVIDHSKVSQGACLDQSPIINRVTKLLANIYNNSIVGYVGLATPCISYIMHVNIPVLAIEYLVRYDSIHVLVEAEYYQ